jgi:hypothetical protein
MDTQIKSQRKAWHLCLQKKKKNDSRYLVKFNVLNSKDCFTMTCGSIKKENGNLWIWLNSGRWWLRKKLPWFPLLLNNHPWVSSANWISSGTRLSLSCVHSQMAAENGVRWLLKMESDGCWKWSHVKSEQTSCLSLMTSAHRCLVPQLRTLEC